MQAWVSVQATTRRWLDVAPTLHQFHWWLQAWSSTQRLLDGAPSLQWFLVFLGWLPKKLLDAHLTMQRRLLCYHLIVQVSGSLPSGGPYWGERVDLDGEGNSGSLFHPNKENQVPPKSPLAKIPLVAQPIISVEKSPSSQWRLLSFRILNADWYSK